MNAEAAHDCILSRCRYCGHPVSLVYEGSTKTKGGRWIMRFRPVDAAGTEVQRDHVCPKAWRVLSVRSVRRFTGSRAVKVEARNDDQDAGRRGA